MNESASLSGLRPGTTYHYRLTATNASGTNKGSDQTFTTVASGGGSVTYDAIGPRFSGAKVADQSALSWNHTISGTSPALLFSVAVGATQDSWLTASATYDGQAMTLLKQVHADNGTAGYEDMFGLLNAPTGTHSVSVKVSGGTPNEITAGSESFDDVTQFGTATNVYGNGSTASVTSSGSTSGASWPGSSPQARPSPRCPPRPPPGSSPTWTTGRARATRPEPRRPQPART